MTDRRVLVLTEQFAADSEGFEPLRRAGLQVEINEGGRVTDEGKLAELLGTGGVVATIAGGEPYTRAVLARAPDLKIIARWGVGHDQVDVAAATERGIPVAMAFGQNHESVAEYAHAMALSLACGLGPRDTMVRAVRWTFDGFHRGLWGGTAGLIGFGRIGQAMARRLVGQDMRVLVHDPLAPPDPDTDPDVEAVSLEALLERSDLVSVHAPLVPETTHLLDDDAFARMRPDAILINTARGPLIDEAALVRALEAGRLAGVGLDVFETEPLPADSPLRRFPNVLLSPHVSGMDREARRRVTARCVDSVLARLEGRRDELVPYTLNPNTL